MFLLLKKYSLCTLYSLGMSWRPTCTATGNILLVMHLMYYSLNVACVMSDQWLDLSDTKHLGYFKCFIVFRANIDSGFFKNLYAYI